jgi:DNA-binding response OmpR family regulator
MGTFQKILLVDDEEVFRLSTCELLKEKGYCCENACDSSSAKEKLKKHQYDLLIADINMPGNAQLELVKNLHASARNIPIILVTGYPTTITAIESLQLQILAYLIKPFEIDELVNYIELGFKQNRTSLNIEEMRNRLKFWDNDLEKLQISTETASTNHKLNESDAFISSAFANITGSILDMKRMFTSDQQLQTQETPCHILNCPRHDDYKAAIEETIAVLTKTKGAFKSRELRDLREKLEKLSD